MARGKKPPAGFKLEAPVSETLTVKFSAGWKDRLQKLIREKDTNPRRLSIAAGLDPSTVTQVLRSSRSPGIETIAPIADQLGVSLDWLVRGRGTAAQPAFSGGQNADIQQVKVIEWESVHNFVLGKHDRVVVMRTETTQAMDPAEGRFRLDFAGTSMAPLIMDGSILDCSTALIEEPEDVVIVWIADQKKAVARQIMPEKVDKHGRITRGSLVTPNEKWGSIAFDTSKGDKILAVVIDVIRPLRRVKRRGVKMAA